MTAPPRCNDINKLVPYVAARVVQVLDALKERGFDPVVFESLREKKRQYWLYCQGRTAAKANLNGVPLKYAKVWANPTARVVTKTLKSKHLTGKACDIISASRQWSWPDKKDTKTGKVIKGFFTALREEAAKVGMQLAGNFELCHIQFGK